MTTKTTSVKNWNIKSAYCSFSGSEGKSIKLFCLLINLTMAFQLTIFKASNDRIFVDDELERSSIPGRNREYFSSRRRPDRLWSPPSSNLTNSYRGFFIVGKAVGA
jgi:hypothetical protein